MRPAEHELAAELEALALGDLEAEQIDRPFRAAGAGAGCLCESRRCGDEAEKKNAVIRRGRTKTVETGTGD